MASSSTYGALRRAADALDAWELERDAARHALRERIAANSDQALACYLQLADEELLQTGRPAYAGGVSMLKRARRAAHAASQSEGLRNCPR